MERVAPAAAVADPEVEEPVRAEPSWPPLWFEAPGCGTTITRRRLDGSATFGSALTCSSSTLTSPVLASVYAM